MATDAERDARIPPYREMLWDTVRALRELGGSGHIDEIADKTIAIGGFSEAQQAVLAPNGRTTALRYRVQWCLSALKAVGLLDNSERGVWSLTEAGQALKETEVPELRTRVAAHYRAINRERRRRRSEARVQPASESSDEDAEDEQSPAADGDQWKDVLLERIKALHPSAFERLVQRLLREADFEKVEVKGRSGDQGIDGVGLVRLGLLSFPTYFQCKRYDGSVGAGAVRDFRGAMAGRGEKGVLITSGTFTPAAQQEATRDGVPPIDLIDGDELCELLKRHRVGVSTRVVEEVTVDEAYWNAFAER
jgi:restriction system protein